MKALNLSKAVVVASDVRAAKSFWERLRGLIGSRPLQAGGGFLIPGCQGIHSFAMSYSIDAVYLDGKFKVAALVKNMKPNRFGPVSFRARFVLELPAGTIECSRTEVGNTFSIDLDA